MKKSFLITAVGLLVLGVAFSGGQAKAQSEPGQGGQGGGMGRRMDPDQQLQRLSQSLNLTDDQKQQIKPILQDRQKQMEAIRSDSTLSDDDKHSKSRAAFEDSNAKIRNLLTDDQKKQFDEMQKRMRGGPRNRGGAENPPPPPPNQ